MKLRRLTIILATVLSLHASGPPPRVESESDSANPWKPDTLPKANSEGFILIRGGTYWSGDAMTMREHMSLERVEDFEMADHPVTNAEYGRFVTATGHESPYHWAGQVVPPGMENHPVIYVNRYDADAYTAWRSRQDGRTYRLPTAAEFEYAARGGLDRKIYPWGDDSPEGRANFDSRGSRNYAAWSTHLEPVRMHSANNYGLHDMAGNVWQMVLTYPDPGRIRYKYRIYTPSDLEGRILGGSWARSQVYLRCGYGGGASPGIRHPDIGFRVVREPRPAAPAFNHVVRRLAAFPTAGNSVFLSWQLLETDPDNARFNVYRTTRRDSAGFRVNDAPIIQSTSYVDRSAAGVRLYYYRVRLVSADGEEGPSSEWAGVEAGSTPTGLWNSFTPYPRKTGGVPVFGDLDGDGLLDVVIRLDNGNVEMSKDSGLPVELEAFTAAGRYLWRKQLVRHEHCFGSASDVPVNVYDLDGDGKAEVICRIQDGEGVFLGVLDGLTGRLLRKTPWPEMLTDFAKSSTRIHLSIAFLDGRRPGIVTQTGLYENEVFVAFDGELRKLWEFRSVGETNGSGSHHIDIADVDGDGKDEVFDGTTCLNGDGTVRWSIYREHPDIVAIKDIIPDRPGLEVYYAVESSVHAGAYVVDAKDGTVIWKINREDDPRWSHAHVGWAADIWPASPGLECLTNRDGHAAKETVLISSSGRIIAEPFPNLMPLEWDGGDGRELIARDGRAISRFDGKQVVALPFPPPSEVKDGRVVMVADLVGDFRDEVVVVGPNADGHFTVSVFSPTIPINHRKTTPAARHAYRMWLAHNLTGGYGSYFERE